MTGICFTKQKELIDAGKLSDWKLKVFGVGSIGSNLIKQAALVGFKDISAYDFDTVEAENIGSQEFRVEHIGMKKTEAIQKMMKGDFNFEVRAIDGKITKDTTILPEAKTIYFCGFDSLGGRKILWDKIKDFPIVWSESRIGRTAQRYYIVDLRNKNEEWTKEYEATLDPNGPMTELKCGEKGCYPSNAELVSKIVRQFVNIAENKVFATMYIGDWGSPGEVYRMPKQEVPREIKYD